MVVTNEIKLGRLKVLTVHPKRPVPAVSELGSHHGHPAKFLASATHLLFCKLKFQAEELLICMFAWFCARRNQNG